MSHTALDTTDLDAVRQAVARDAARLARPRLWSDTIGALATTLTRAVGSVAPEAPVMLLSAAAKATGAPQVGPLRTEPGVIAGAQRLVRNGGPAYIKLGQFIASADGLLPAEWVEAFAWCRDDAPRLPLSTVLAIVEREAGPGRVAALDEEPIAAGSIGQVHRAWLTDGRHVVVKVRRPGLHRQLRSDIGGLALVAAAAGRLGPTARALDLPGFVALFAQLTLEELDFRLEAQNLVQSAAAFESCGLQFVEVPRPQLATERLLIMDHLEGVPYNRAHNVLGRDVDGERLLRMAVGGVLATTLVHGVFHGDLHAGNVLVRADGSFGLVDFGICGRLDRDGRAGLAAYLAAFAAGDAHGQIDALRALDAIPPDADLVALGAELGVELEQLGHRHHGAVTFERLGDTVGRQLTILARNGFRMPKELVIFFKNLLYLSSFAAAIAPEADLLTTIEHALEDLNDDARVTMVRALAGRSASGASTAL